MGTHKHVGELLVEAGIISVKTLERALERQQGSGRRIGAILEDMGVVTEDELVDVMAAQLSMRSAKKIRGHSFPPALLALIPAEFAVQHTVFPLQLKEGALAVAVADPTAVNVLDDIARMTGHRVMAILSSHEEIAAAIREYYFKGEEVAKTSPCRILVVEDSPVVANVIKAALEREGFEVLQAADGVEGLKAALSSKPCLILCDAVMPRMDGFGLRRALAAQAETADTPVILLTSKASPEEEQKALSSGFFDFIAKPVNAVRIISRIRRALAMTAKNR